MVTRAENSLREAEDHLSRAEDEMAKAASKIAEATKAGGDRRLFELAEVITAHAELVRRLASIAISVSHADPLSCCG